MAKLEPLLMYVLGAWSSLHYSILVFWCDLGRSLWWTVGRNPYAVRR